MIGFLNFCFALRGDSIEFNRDLLFDLECFDVEIYLHPVGIGVMKILPA